MTVEAPDFRCTLTNTNPEPEKGLTNNVHVRCVFRNAMAAAGIGEADVSNSIVKVTGPE
jgi:hypothetical protein